MRNICLDGESNTTVIAFRHIVVDKAPIGFNHYITHTISIYVRSVNFIHFGRTFIPASLIYRRLEAMSCSKSVVKRYILEEFCQLASSIGREIEVSSEHILKRGCKRIPARMVEFHIHPGLVVVEFMLVHDCSAWLEVDFLTGIHIPWTAGSRRIVIGNRCHIIGRHIILNHRGSFAHTVFRIIGIATAICFQILRPVIFRSVTASIHFNI